MRDFCNPTYGFKSVEYLSEVLGGELEASLFKGVNELLKNFPHSYTRGGAKLELSFENQLQLSDEDLADLWVDRFDEYLIYKPFEDSQSSKFAAKLNRKALSTIKINAPRYLSILYSLDAAYNPINNYDMVEKEIRSSKLSGYTDTGSLTRNGTDNSTTTRTGKQTSVEGETGTISTTTENGIAPFNLNVAMGSGIGQEGLSNGQPPLQSKQVVINSPSDDRAITTTTTYGDNNGDNGVKDTKVGTNSTTGSNSNSRQFGSEMNTNQELENIQLSGHEADDKVLTRRGNIGITTSQQLLESEIELKRKSLIKMFFDDFNEQVLLTVLEAMRSCGFESPTPSGDFITRKELAAILLAYETKEDAAKISLRIDEVETSIDANTTAIAAANKRIDDISGTTGVSYEAFEAEQLRVNGELDSKQDQIDENATSIEGIRESLENKVDKEVGKTLTSNDFTNADKEKLSSLENYNDSELRALISNNTSGLTSIYNNSYNRGVNISATTGWWRIASIDAAGYISGADVVLYRSYNNARPELVHFQLLDSSYGSDFRFLGGIGSPQFFSKIRLVKGQPTQPAYLEVYYTSSNRNNIFAQVIPYSSYTDSRLWKPTTDVEQATGGIPEGYTATEFDLNDGAAALSTNAMMVQGDNSRANLLAALDDNAAEI